MKYLNILQHNIINSLCAIICSEYAVMMQLQNKKIFIDSFIVFVDALEHKDAFLCLEASFQYICVKNIIMTNTYNVYNLIS